VARIALFSTKVALCLVSSFAERKLEIKFGVSHSRNPKDEAARQSYDRNPDLAAGQGQPELARTPASVPGQTAAARNFWDCLNTDQRRLFRAKAHNRVFAAGARLMQEGEEADHVAVILSGLTQIRVYEHGAERVVAERGPGQLIGERAALEVNVRSATVVALQTVVALVMRTSDFAAFISTNPAVLKIVEEQIYLRLREEPPSTHYYRDLGDGRLATAARPLELTGQNCTVVRTDVVRFNSGERDGEAQKIIRRETLAMTRLALGPVWDTCRWEDRGDGLLVIVGPDVPTAQIIERLVTALPPRLKQHNRTYSESSRIQLRIAAEVGPIEDDEPGVCGPSINHVSRLVEAPAFKRAIDDQDAMLGLIVSPFVYRAHVRLGGSLLDPADFTEIPVQVKETDATGWIRLTGRSGTGLGQRPITVLSVPPGSIVGWLDDERPAGDTEGKRDRSHRSGAGTGAWGSGRGRAGRRDVHHGGGNAKRRRGADAGRYRVPHLVHDQAHHCGGDPRPGRGRRAGPGRSGGQAPAGTGRPPGAAPSRRAARRHGGGGASGYRPRPAHFHVGFRDAGRDVHRDGNLAHRHSGGRA
jgi:hypothetical protein